MAIIFSPLSDDGLLNGPYKLYPRHGFIMLHDNEKANVLDKRIAELCNQTLEANDFIPLKASDLRGTGDFLNKILQAIRGCGFGVVIFTEHTPASTLANIFFEAGICLILGKPVIIVKTPVASPPSDFIRTEWIIFADTDEIKFQRDFEKSIQAMLEQADFFKTLGNIAMDATNTDLELAFERYKQAVLIANDRESLEKIKQIKDVIDATASSSLTVHETNLRQTIEEFVQLTP